MPGDKDKDAISVFLQMCYMVNSKRTEQRKQTNYTGMYRRETIAVALKNIDDIPF